MARRMLTPKPPRPFPPQPRRLPERKRMTIALGILATDGVVIAADTQEGSGYPGGTKTSGHKIMSRNMIGQFAPSGVVRERSIASTGAGWSGHLDAFHQNVIDGFEVCRNPSLGDRAIKDTVYDFYQRHILPLHVLGETRQPSADLIIGVSWKGDGPRLMATENSTARRCKGYVAVGAGREHASMLLSRILPEPTDVTVQLASYLAVYTIFHVKEFIEGCGKNTHVVILKDGHAHYMRDETVSVLELRFNDYLRFDAVAVNYILGRPLKEEGQALNPLIGYLKSIRKNALDLQHVNIESRDFDLDWGEPTPSIPQPMNSLATKPTPQ